MLGRMLLSTRPGPLLESAVECLWHYRGGDTQIHGRERVVPNGRFQLVLDLTARVATVSGLRIDHVVVDAANLPCAMGVVFRPGGATRFFEGSALDFYGRAVPLASVWGPRTRLLLDQLGDESSARKRIAILEVALANVCRERDGKCPVPPAVEHALRTFHATSGIKTIANVSREVGWSRRWLTQSFAESVGMAPKRYCRLLRFQHVVRQVVSGRRIDWANLAIVCGFCDQAHLAHEFRAFSGLTPEGFLGAQRPFANHVRLD
jgi:AraC-like DNA-binding protein